MILAAGQGRRLHPLTCHRPKPLLRVGGRSLIDWHLQALRGAGADRAVINSWWLAEDLRRSVEALSVGDMNLCWSRQPRLYGTAGDIRLAMSLIQVRPAAQQPFAVINGDIFTDYPRKRLLRPDRAPDGKSLLAHMVLVPVPPGRSGDCDLTGGKVRPVPPGQKRWMFSGLSILHPQLLSALPPLEQPDLWSHALRPAAAKGQVSGEIWSGFWADPGTHARLTSLRAQLDRLDRSDSAGHSLRPDADN